MLEYHVYKKYAVAAKYRPTNEQVVEIDDTRGNPPVPVRAIREQCFSGAKIGLVTLPKSVTTIEARAFYESTVTSLVTVRTPGEIHLKEIGESAFQRSHLDGQIRLVVCDGSLEIGPDAFSECSELEEVEIVGSGIVKIHERAFKNCAKLRVFRCMEAKLTFLPEGTFQGCEALHTIAIPSLCRVGPRACANCHSLHGFPAVLDSFYPDSFEGCNIRHPTIRRQKKRKCNDDTLRIPSYEEIQAMLETNEPDIPPSSFRSFHDKYRDCTPILSFTITSRSGSEKPTLRHPVIKGYFRSSLVQKDIFHFEVTFPRDAENITLTTACEEKFKPLLTYLANGSTIIQLTGMESEDGALYNVFEVEPNLGSNTVLTPKFFQEILARLCGKPRTDFVIETADQARLFLTFMEDTGLVPENILLAIRHELENYETQPKEVQKHRLEALKAFTTIDFNPITKLHIPTLDSLQSSFDQEFGGMTRVKQTYLSAAASIRQTGKMPGRRGIVLVGPPGTGKSHITQTFCKETGLELIVLDFSAMGDGSNLQGSGREYSNGTYSLIIQKALQTKQRQMRFVVQVEEVDKCPHLQNTLLNMLTGCFYDSYLQASINTEQLFFVMTANSVSEISGPLLSRLKVIHLDTYSRDDKRKILRTIIVPEANRVNNLNPGGFQLQATAEEVLLDMYEDCPGIREIKNAVCGDLVDAYFLECQKHPESQALRRVFTKSDVRRILGPSAICKSKTYDPNPGEVAFLYTNESGVPTRGIVQVSFCISDTPPSVEILGAVGMQRDHISMAISALKRSTSFNLSEIDLVIALPEPIQSQMNVIGFPLFIALQSALREEAIAPRTLLIGGGVDLFGNGYLPKIGAMTSLIKKAIDCHADILISPEGFTARTDTVDLDKTPLIIESNSANDLARYILKS